MNKGDGGGSITGGGYLRLTPSEHSCTVHCDQAHYGPVYGGGAEAGFKGGQSMVGSGRLVIGGYADGGSVGRTDGGGEETDGTEMETETG